MRAAVLEAQGQPLVVQTVPDPEPGPGEVVLTVEACGICGSDLHAAEQPLAGTVFGHEFCGTVAAVGHDVHDWREGDRAAGRSLASCGRCAACLTGRPRKCPTARMIGIEVPGAYAEHVVLPAHDLHRLPDGLDPALGALVEPLSVALHGVARAGVRPGDDVVVLGAGPVGLAVALWLPLLGARNVIVSDPADGRRALADSLGFHVVDPTTEDVATAVVHAAGRPAPVVIECVGVPGLLQHATDIAAVDGRVSVVGVCMTSEELVPLVPMAKELDLRFAFYYTAEEFSLTIDALHRERLDASPLLTGDVDLDGLPERFEALKQPGDDCKVLVRP